VLRRYPGRMTKRAVEDAAWELGLSRTGKILWGFQTASGIIGQPVTWDRNGKQYITVMSGIGGVYAQRGGDPNLANAPTGVSLWTFALFDK
jgi:alcohol dehydrogenase (cytochrome c)